jgi:hypothetical protein
MLHGLTRDDVVQCPPVHAWCAVAMVRSSRMPGCNWIGRRQMADDRHNLGDSEATIQRCALLLKRVEDYLRNPA